MVILVIDEFTWILNEFQTFVEKNFEKKIVKTFWKTNFENK